MAEGMILEWNEVAVTAGQTFIDAIRSEAAFSICIEFEEVTVGGGGINGTNSCLGTKVCGYFQFIHY